MYVFVRFCMGIMLVNFHICGMMLLFNAMLYMLVRYAGARGPMCFSYLMFNLSGPAELLFLSCYIASWT